MCDTIPELDKKNDQEHAMIRGEINGMAQALNARFDMLEGLLVKHAEKAPASLSPLLSEMRDDIKEVKEQTKKTNGRVTLLEKWQAELRGGSNVIKSIWGILAVFIVASIFGLFRMYVAFENIEYTIATEIQSQLDGYQFEIIE